MNTQSRFVVTLSTIATLAVAAWAAKAAEPVNIENIKTISATVESIDVAKQSLWLRGQDGRSLMVEVPHDVSHLTQAKVGDKVLVRYHESIAVAIKPKGAAKSQSSSSSIARGAPESIPDVVSGRTISTTVVIQSVNKSSYAVAFKDADGFSRNTTVENPELRKFVATLKPGDEVELAYNRALAVSVELEKDSSRNKH
jgi:hypothetical protein